MRGVCLRIQIELKTSARLAESDLPQLKALAQLAADEGRELVYVFLNNPGESTVKMLRSVGGKAVYLS